jgi:hypothetical protein
MYQQRYVSAVVNKRAKLICRQRYNTNLSLYEGDHALNVSVT